MRKIELPISGKQTIQIWLVNKRLHQLSIAGRNVDMVQLIEVLHENLPQVEIGEPHVESICSGQQTQIEKRDRIETLVKKLTHVELGDEKVTVIGYLVFIGQLADKLLCISWMGTGNPPHPREIGLQVEIGQGFGNFFVLHKIAQEVNQNGRVVERLAFWIGKVIAVVVALDQRIDLTAGGWVKFVLAINLIKQVIDFGLGEPQIASEGGSEVRKVAVVKAEANSAIVICKTPVMKMLATAPLSRPAFSVLKKVLRKPLAAVNSR